MSIRWCASLSQYCHRDIIGIPLEDWTAISLREKKTTGAMIGLLSETDLYLEDYVRPTGKIAHSRQPIKALV